MKATQRNPDNIIHTLAAFFALAVVKRVTLLYKMIQSLTKLGIKTLIEPVKVTNF